MRVSRNRCSFLALTGLLTFGPLVHAATLTWTLQDVTFSNGETASGTMVVDTTLDSQGFYLVEAWNITLGGLPTGYLTALAGTANVNTYSCSTPADAACIVETGYYLTTPVQGALLFGAATAPFGSGIGLSSNMALDFQEGFFPPTAGVTIPLLLTTSTVQESYISAYNFNTGQYADVGNLVTGSIVETATAPEPATTVLAALGGASLLLYATRRRRRIPKIA
jgi:hypothetical protein